MQKYKKVIACCAGVAVIFIWAGWITLSRYGMKTPLTPSDLTMLRYATALCFVSPLLLWYDWKKHSLSQWLVVGLGVGFPYTLLSFYGLKTIGAAHAGVLVNGMLPVLGTIAAYFIFSQKISYLKYLAIILIFVSNAMMAGGDVVRPEMLGGFLMLVGAAVVYTAHMTGIRLWNVHFKDVIVMVPLVNVVLFLPFFLLQPTSFDQIEISELAVHAVYQGIVVNIVALMCVAYAIHHLGTIVVSLFMSFVPVVTAVFGWIFLEENLNGMQLLGIAGCTTGLLIYGLGAADSLRLLLRAIRSGRR
jgi:drug/metabolite transporter (DMT)-like permease